MPLPSTLPKVHLISTLVVPLNGNILRLVRFHSISHYGNTITSCWSQIYVSYLSVTLSPVSQSKSLSKQSNSSSGVFVWDKQLNTHNTRSSLNELFTSPVPWVAHINHSVNYLPWDKHCSFIPTLIDNSRFFVVARSAWGLCAARWPDPFNPTLVTLLPRVWFYMKS